MVVSRASLQRVRRSRYILGTSVRSVSGGDSLSSSIEMNINPHHPDRRGDCLGEVVGGKAVDEKFFHLITTSPRGDCSGSVAKAITASRQCSASLYYGKYSIIMR